MAINMTEVNKIVARCRRIGWKVETGGGRQEWHYRITPPDGSRIAIHKTPSDRNWKASMMRQLEACGFTAAEQAWLVADEADRAARLEADRHAAEVKAERAAAKRAKTSRALDVGAGEYAVLPVDINWLLTPAELPQTRTVLMTPEAAAKALATINTGNRHKRDNRTQDFVDIIETGDWGATHQGAAIDTNGVLQDGQHRFAAIVETGQTLPMMVSVGMSPENFRKVDTPLVRSARDAAQIRGEVNVSALTAAARMILNLDRDGTDAHVYQGRRRMSIDIVDRAIIAMGDDLRNAVLRGQRIRKELKCNAAAITTAIYKIRGRLPENDPRVEAFFEQLETGIGVTKSHPVWLLRRKFILAASADGKRVPAWETLAYTIKAWNFVARGAKISSLVWRSNEGFPAEPFLPPPIGEPLPEGEADA